MQTRFLPLTGGRLTCDGARTRFDFRAMPLFSNLDGRAVGELEEAAVRQTFRRRANVFAQGDPATRLYVVVAGQIRLSRCSVEGREVSIAFVGPGGTIGEEAVFTDRAYAWSATCCSPAQLLGISRSQVRRCLRTDPAFAVNVAAIFQHRLEQMSLMLERVAYDRVGTRLLELLRMLAAESGWDGADGTTFRLEFTHHDLASVIASTRETVTSELANLVRAGRISFQGRRLVTLRGSQLEANESRKRAWHLAGSP